MLSPFITEIAIRTEHAVLVDRLERHPWHRHADELARRRERRTRDEARRGARAMLPFLVGYIPFGLVLGATVASGGPFLARWAGSFLIMGGSAQLAVLQLLDHGAALALVVVTGLVVNARLVVYSASLAPDWAGASWRARLVAALGIIDPTWAVAQQRLGTGGRAEDRRAYYAGAALTLCSGWLLLVTAGALLGGTLDVAATAIAVPLCLLQLVLPRLRSASGRAAVLVAAGAAWFGAALPAGTGMLLAVVGGVVAATLASAVTTSSAASTAGSTTASPVTAAAGQAARA